MLKTWGSVEMVSCWVFFSPFIYFTQSKVSDRLTWNWRSIAGLFQAVSFLFVGFVFPQPPMDTFHHLNVVITPWTHDFLSPKLSLQSLEPATLACSLHMHHSMITGGEETQIFNFVHLPHSIYLHLHVGGNCVNLHIECMAVVILCFGVRSLVICHHSCGTKNITTWIRPLCCQLEACRVTGNAYHYIVVMKQLPQAN